MAGTDSFGLVGSILDQNYRIDGVLGEGGFGVVYKGWHLAFDEPVAIKCLKVPLHFTAEARRLFEQRFREEGKLLRKLGERHPAVVRAHDVRILSGTQGRLDGVPYMVLEWLDGHTLDAALRQRMERGQGPFAENEAIALLTPAMDALAMAHRGDLGQVIAHRDIKPENLFVLRDGRVKVLDFGIAKAMQEGDEMTQQQSRTSSGFSAFSPGYGAPEQFSSRKYGESGPWTDVHALGLVLSEMIAGRSPYEGGQYADLFLEAVAAERPTPRKHGARVSDAFEAVCARALSLRPQERFQSAGDMLAALRRGLELPASAGAPVVASASIGAAESPAVNSGAPWREPAVPARTEPGVTPPVRTELEPLAPPVRTELEPRVALPVRTELAPVLPGPPPASARGAGARPGRWAAGAAGVVALAVGIATVWNNHMEEEARQRLARQAQQAKDAQESEAARRELERLAAAATAHQRKERIGRMVKFDASSFAMGSAEGEADERPVHPARVATFWMDVTEVTVGAWKLCVQEGGCAPAQGVLVKGMPASEAARWSAHCTLGLPGHDDHPINCVDASQAEAFCKWAGKRLPTEEEWEFAAYSGWSGGDEVRRFAWGMDDPDKTRLNACDSECVRQMKAEGMAGFESAMFAGSDGFATTAPVRKFPANAAGLHDMAGNVSEWTASGYTPTYGAAVDPSRRVNRGAHWEHSERRNARLARRFKDAPDTRDVVLGFRCASDTAP